MNTRKSTRFNNHRWQRVSRFARGLWLRLAAVFALAVLTAASANAVALQSPYGLAADPNTGVVYIADPVAGGVLAYDPVTGAVSTFAAVSDAFSLAADSNGNVYVGIVGASTRIAVYSPSGTLINTLAVPQGDSPLTLAIDGGNVLYQANWGNGEDRIGINIFNNDVLAPYSYLNNKQFLTIASNHVYTGTTNVNHMKYALAAEGGQIFIVVPGNASNHLPNIYDSRVLMSDQIGDGFYIPGPKSDYVAKYLKVMEIVGGLWDGKDISDAWFNAHTFPVLGAAAAASFDAAHNLFYSDNEQSAIVTTSKSGPATQLLTGLPSAPYGIVYNKVRKRLYVAFPAEHLVRSYRVAYTMQDPKVPTALTLFQTIQ